MSHAAGVIAWPADDDESRCTVCGNHLNEMSLDGSDQHMVRAGHVSMGCGGTQLPNIAEGNHFSGERRRAVASYTVSLSLNTGSDCASATEAAEIFAAAVAGGLLVTVVDDGTGVSQEVHI